MNGYLTSALSALLSWVRGLAAAVWQMVTGEDAGTLLQFVTGHWKGILLVLCAAGLLADLLVYLFRWQPYKVWISFVRRLRDRREVRDAEEVREETVPSGPLPAAEAAQQETPAGPARVRRRRAAFPENETPREEATADAVPDDTNVFPGVETAGTEGEASPRRRRRRSAR